MGAEGWEFSSIQYDNNAGEKLSYHLSHNRQWEGVPPLSLLICPLGRLFSAEKSLSFLSATPNSALLVFLQPSVSLSLPSILSPSFLVSAPLGLLFTRTTLSLLQSPVPFFNLSPASSLCPSSSPRLLLSSISKVHVPLCLTPLPRCVFEPADRLCVGLLGSGAAERG